MSDDKKNVLPDPSEAWREERKRQIAYRILRYVLAVLLFVSYFFLGKIAVFFMAFGACLIAPDIAALASRAFMSSLFPHRKGELRPIYGIAESLAARGKYAEAEEEYEKIIQQFPKEVKPHIDMLNIAVMRLNDGLLAEQLYQRGMNLLKDPVSQNTLTEAYNSIRTRLKKPEDLKPVEISSNKFKDVKERVARDRKKMWR